MRIAEYKQISTQTEKRIIHHDAIYDTGADGTTYGVIQKAYDEEVSVEVPVMGLVYRDATAEEESELANNIPVDVPQEKTVEEQIAELREAIDALLRGDTE